jgi:hypothetical protein
MKIGDVIDIMDEYIMENHIGCLKMKLIIKLIVRKWGFNTKISINNIMPDILLICTLVRTIFTGVTQVIQIYFNYKTAKHHGHSDIYKVYQSNCCSIIKEPYGNH